MNLYRLVRAYVDFEFAPGGPAAYLSELAPWDHVFKDTIYATTELFGDAISVSDLIHFMISTVILNYATDLSLLGRLGTQLESHRSSYHPAHRQHQYVLILSLLFAYCSTW